MTRLRALAALALTCGLAATQLAFKWYELAGDPDEYVRWYVDEIPVFLDDRLTPDAAPEDVREAVAKSIATWNDVGCLHPLLAVPIEVSGVPPMREIDGHTQGSNLIVFQNADEWAQYHTEKPDNILDMSKVLALTTLYYRPDTGEARSYSLEINNGAHVFSAPPAASRTPFTQVQPTTGTNDIQNMLTHELGHVLGLDHPCSTSTLMNPCSETTMYPKAPLGETKKRTLDQDDMDGLCGLYGDDWVPQPPELPGHGGGCVASPGPHAMPDPPYSTLLTLLLAPLALAVLRRRCLDRVRR